MMIVIRVCFVLCVVFLEGVLCVNVLVLYTRFIAYIHTLPCTQCYVYVYTFSHKVLKLMKIITCIYNHVLCLL